MENLSTALLLFLTRFHDVLKAPQKAVRMSYCRWARNIYEFQCPVSMFTLSEQGLISWHYISPLTEDILRKTPSTPRSFPEIRNQMENTTDTFGFFSFSFPPSVTGQLSVFIVPNIIINVLFLSSNDRIIGS